MVDQQSTDVPAFNLSGELSADACGALVERVDNGGCTRPSTRRVHVQGEFG